MSGTPRAMRLLPKTLLALAALALAGLLLALFSGPAEAATFTVNRTGDASDRNINNSVCDVSRRRGKQCTLRAAIQEANNTPGADTINFNIGGTAAVKTISPASPLPIITEDVTINGYTQRGARANTLAEGNNAVLKIQLNGTNAGDANGLLITASNSTIKGLVINRFEAHGVLIFKSLSGSVLNNVEGNFIGTNASGTQDLGNGVAGVSIGGVSDNTIGGTDPGARNIISGNGDAGVRITESTATGNEVLGNFIGTDKNGTANLGNAGDGVFIENGPNNTVGGTTSGARNVISGNDGDGVEVVGTGATGNSILSNQIFSNDDLGIDLGTNGVTANDNDDSDTGSNNLQNFADILSAKRSSATGFTTISGTLNSTPSQSFTIQCFVADGDPSGHGEGQIPVGQTTAVTNANGATIFSCPDNPIPQVNQTVTATATNTATGDTSEFSENVRVS